MKKLIVLFVFVCAGLMSYAQGYESIYTLNESICIGDSISFTLPFDSVNVCVCQHDGIYDTIYSPTIVLKPGNNPGDIVTYEVIMVNGEIPIDLYRFVIVSKVPPTISIPPASIHHVTCPDGWDYPYADGGFHVSLDDSVQNYAWINISNESVPFSHQTFDSVTLTDLRSGTYYVTAHGINGCDYTDSVVIEQPDPWIDYGSQIDTVCPGETGCIEVELYGGTPPYNFTWFYYEYMDNELDTIFLSDTTRMVCGLEAGGKLYHAFMYDSRGCKVWGEEVYAIYGYLYEHVEDSTHIITTDSLACYGGDFLVQAQSIGLGTYTWNVGGIQDSVNYWTSIYGDSMFVADYYTPAMMEPTWVFATFTDQHGCVTQDSIWVDVYNLEISLHIGTTEIVTDSTCTVHVSPPGGNLYVDDTPIAYSIPEDFTFSTTGISVGEHTLKYAGIFGAELGLSCEDEIILPFQVETNPFVPDWEYNVSIYPNPATTILNLTSTGISDFELSILDITGKVIKTERMLDQTFAFDVSDLASGIYMLRLVSHDGSSKVVKFVKR